ncbi:hypothetical protein ATY76_08840 [Rhizobium sp. R339]|nr:hypothetical protein ATY76_08840 [Rhizobium sp. R339]
MLTPFCSRNQAFGYGNRIYRGRLSMDIDAALKAFIGTVEKGAIAAAASRCGSPFGAAEVVGLRASDEER